MGQLKLTTSLIERYIEITSYLHSMLSSAVCGNVFASPNSRQVTMALEGLKGGKGCVSVGSDTNVLHLS